jgi:hypothetical protein
MRPYVPKFEDTSGCSYDEIWLGFES